MTRAINLLQRLKAQVDRLGQAGKPIARNGIEVRGHRKPCAALTRWAGGDLVVVTPFYLNSNNQTDCLIHQVALAPASESLTIAVSSL
ncbi:hypothetical protein TBK1r_48550 [Stieleria magnilauensis]|uniref:Uncharacterized protein n=1 Tax=Stieleria magnilauensis TaxID=2527963 RepID=A0ABX5Y187_9BACT|nr:hypothetical protein TBK1r_48550 [Planctomycetes bacterium TBK1r]